MPCFEHLLIFNCLLFLCCFSLNRQTLATQPTPSSAGLPADLKLTQQSFDRIIALSDELDMNELDAATKWHNASKKELVLQMVQLTGRDVGDLETKPEETVKY